MAAVMAIKTRPITPAFGVEVLGLGYMEAYYNRPREWGLDLGYKF